MTNTIEVSYLDAINSLPNMRYYRDIKTRVCWVAYYKGLIPTPYSVARVEQHPDKDVWVLTVD